MSIGICRFDELARIQLGGQTFLNDFFYVDAQQVARFGIEDAYLEPVFLNSDTRKSKDHFTQTSGRIAQKLFTCRQDISELVGTGAAAYVQWGARQSHKPVDGRAPIPWKDTPRLQKDGHPWYYSRFNAPPARIVVLKAVDEYFAPFVFDRPIRVDQRFNQINPKPGVDEDILVGLLCSTWFVMLCETFGATSMGQGALEIRTDTLKSMPVPDIRQLEPSLTQDWKLAAHNLTSGERLTAVRACATPRQKALDSVVLRSLDLPTERLTELHDDTLRMGNVRKTLAAGRGTMKRERFESDVAHVAQDIASHLGLLLGGRRFPQDYLPASHKGESVQLGTAPMRVHSELMMGTRQTLVTTMDGQIVFAGSLPAASGEYFIRAVEANQRSFCLPTDEPAAEAALDELRQLATRLDQKLQELIATVGVTHRSALRAQAEKELNFPIADLLAEVPAVYDRER